MTKTNKLKVSILTAIDSPPILSVIIALTKLPEVQITGILFDSEQPSLFRRLRNLKRNVKREGPGFIPFRIWQFIITMLESLAARLVSKSETLALLTRAFPEVPQALVDFNRMFQIPIHYVQNLNSPTAADVLRGMNADLGIVIGTRILKRSTFSLPRMGCINVHKGKVPEYRGLPPGFWELYENQKHAGVTIHFVDDGLDTGDIIGEDCIPLHHKDSVETVQRKLDVLAENLLLRSVIDLARGQVRRRTQPISNLKPKTSPTQAQRRELENRRGLPSPVHHSLSYALKTAFALLIYYSGLFHLVRLWKKVTGTNRVCVILYHRVNDLCEDALTTSVRRFAEHLIAIQKHYSVITSSELLNRLKQGVKFDVPTVVIHFDDCYRDVYVNASRILGAANLHACAFISSGFVGTTRQFLHDLALSPFTLENLSQEELIGLLERNFEIGSHSVSHTDLGRCDNRAVCEELIQSKKDLEAMLNKPVTVFSYPFGGKHNVRPGIADLVRHSGYQAMFSAYGGYVNRRTDPFNIPRIGASGQFRPIDLILEIEGLSFGTIRRVLKTQLLGAELLSNPHD